VEIDTDLQRLFAALIASWYYQYYLASAAANLFVSPFEEVGPWSFWYHVSFIRNGERRFL
jgi:hypothetical protein